MRMYLRWLEPACGALLLVATMYAIAQTFHSGTTLVTVPATVVDAKGQQVWGLTASDFAVYDDRQLQIIRLDDGWIPPSRALIILVEQDDDTLLLKESLNTGLVAFVEGLPADNLQPSPS